MDGWRDGLNRLWRDGVTILPRPAKKIATAKNNRPVPALEQKKKNTAPSRPVEKKTQSHPVPPRKKKTTAPSRLGKKTTAPSSLGKKTKRPVPPRKKNKPAPSRHEQQNTPPRGWKLETNTTACLFFSLSCCTFISYCSLVRSIFLFLVFGWWSLSHTDTNTPPLSLCLAVMDAYLNPQPNNGAGQPPQKQERQKSHHRRSSSSSRSSSSQHHLAHQMLLALGLASMRKHRPCGCTTERFLS